MSTLSAGTARSILTRLGFRVNTNARYVQSLRDFQAGWNLGAMLEIDGLLGPKTSAALLQSEKNRIAGRGTASAHFSFKELVCHCGGRYSACRRVCGEGPVRHGRHVLRYGLQRLEKTRAAYYPKGMSVVSGYRCDGHNKAVGGATSSQHRFGAAFDIERVIDKDDLKRKGWWSGIGYKKANDLVQHVDVRNVSGVNPTKGGPTNPTVWIYS